MDSQSISNACFFNCPWLVNDASSINNTLLRNSSLFSYSLQTYSLRKIHTIYKIYSTNILVSIEYFLLEIFILCLIWKYHFHIEILLIIFKFIYKFLLILSINFFIFIILNNFDFHTFFHNIIDHLCIYVRNEQLWLENLFSLCYFSQTLIIFTINKYHIELFLHRIIDYKCY